MKLTPKSGGLALAVKVVPGASRTRIVGPYGDGLKITVSAPPERGAANDAVIELLAAALQIPRSDIQILSGHTNPRKQLLITGLNTETIQERLGI